MAYTFRREPALTQHILQAVIGGTAIAIGSTAWFAEVWTGLIESSSERVLLTGGLMLLHTVIFWTVCSAFHYVDTTDRPHFIAKHRTQRERRKHPDMATTLKVLARNQFVFLPVLLLILGELLIARGWTAEVVLPTLPRLVAELVAQGVIGMAVFYASHRFLHRKWWMKRVHRIHHEFKTTTAWASEYAHPAEFLVGNFASLALGALIIAPHLISMYLFAAMAVINVLVHHSGYALPWAPWSLPHDWHHYRVKELFGTTGFIDRVLGTSPEFESLEEGEIS